MTDFTEAPPSSQDVGLAVLLGLDIPASATDSPSSTQMGDLYVRKDERGIGDDRDGRPAGRGMHMMTWVIGAGFAVVLGGLMLYRLATIKARR